MRTLAGTDHDALGIDVLASPFTEALGSIVDRGNVRRCMAGIDAVIHTASLHKPHIATHSRQDFVDTNITGTLNLLEEASLAGVRSFVFTSTTSAFGAALESADRAPAAWITEDVTAIPKNIYGLTKTAAEDLCELFRRRNGLPSVVLRTARFFPEADDSRALRAAYQDGNAKANEFLFRRVDLEDVVSAHLNAMERAPAIGFSRYIISATTPFWPEDLAGLHEDAAAVVRQRVPACEAEYQRHGWRLFPSIDRVYVNRKARGDLGWRPKYDFGHIVGQLKAGEEPGSDLARTVGAKSYHAEVFAEGPYPVE